MKIGNNVKIGRDVIISTSKSDGIPIITRNDVMIAHRSLIIGRNHEHSRIDIPMNTQSKGAHGPIKIEDDVWIGSGCIILSSVKIGKGSIVGSGSVLVKDIASYSLAAGVPAKVIKNRKNENISQKQNLSFKKCH